MLTYWWFSIFRPQDWIYIDITSIRLPLLATAIFFLPAIFRGDKPFVKDSLVVMMLLLYFFMIIAALTVGCSSTYKTIEPISYMGLLIFAIMLSVGVIKNQKTLLYWIVVVTLSVGFFAGKAGVVAMLAGGQVNYGATNLKGLFSGSNAFAMGTASMLFLMVFLFLQAFNRKTLAFFPGVISKYKLLLKIALFVIVVGSAFNIVSLYSRGSALAAGGGFLVFYLLSSNKIRIGLYLIPFLVVGAVLIPVPEGYGDRLGSSFEQSDDLDSSAASRPHFWKTAVLMVNTYPLGVGPGCYREFYNEFDDSAGMYGLYRDVHSSHFQMWAENGYIGLLLWLGLFLLTYKRLFKLRSVIKLNVNHIDNPLFYKQLVDALIASQTVFIVGGGFYSLAYTDLIWFFWGVTVSITKLVDGELGGGRGLQEAVN